MKEIAMLYSGGLDSYVSAAMLLGSGNKVRALFFDYGQVTAASEYVAAVNCVKDLKEAYGRDSVSLERVHLSDYIRYVEGCSLVGGMAESTKEDNDGRLTFIPGRNILFLLMAAVATYKSGVRELAFSSHKSDTVAGDCRPEFISALQSAFQWGFGMKGEQEPYRIWSPLGAMTKGQVVLEGVRRHLNLDLSWSCYRAGTVHCGECRNCVDRKMAFIEAKLSDTTKYAKLGVPVGEHEETGTSGAVCCR